MTRPTGCPGKCIYCPNDPTVPRSYTTQSPAVLRAIRYEFDPRRQVEARLRMLRVMGHPTDKIELIVMGGTFLASPVEYQYGFIQGCYDALNGAESRSLTEAKLLNETSAHRCVGLCIETRPDWCGADEVRRMHDFGATRVELGVQALDDRIYELVRRGHDVAAVVRATRLLKQHGFKVHYHWMPGLPGSSLKHDLEMSDRLFSDTAFQPDGMKLYPTLVVQGTELERWYGEGLYKPYSMDQLADLLVQIKARIPAYVRVSRVMRDIPPQFIVAGCKDLALRDALKKHLAGAGVECQCIRCREYGHRTRNGRRAGIPSLHRMDYESAGGTEVLLSFEDENRTLFGLLRLRLEHEDGGASPAMVRELHVYGPEIPLQKHSDSAAQHKGIGKQLLREAERVAREEFGRRKILVLSGVGARQYYAAEGYGAEDAYMGKVLKSEIINVKS